eukprot:m.120549 g.120549  ORF g.120549 m.120549 type:complete len:61 (-) comp28809_c0_seq2:2211-2393(-)
MFSIPSSFSAIANALSLLLSQNISFQKGTLKKKQVSSPPKNKKTKKQKTKIKKTKTINQI